MAEEKPVDAGELIEWIQSLTEGERLVDHQHLEVYHYYSPHIGGSNSIKAVLTAVLTESPKLKENYSNSYSGLYLKDKIVYWEDKETGHAISPYQLLDPIHRYGLTDRVADKLILEDGEVIAEGGTAMMACSRIQFDDISDAEREAVLQSLLEYCELNTLSILMIWQRWEWLRANEN